MKKKIEACLIGASVLEELIKEHYNIYFSNSVTERESTGCKFKVYFVKPKLSDKHIARESEWMNNSSYSPLFCRKQTGAILRRLCQVGLVAEGFVIIDYTK